MSADITLSQEIFNTIVSYYDGYLTAQYDTLMSSFKIFFRSVLIIWLIYCGYKLASNKEESWFDIIKTFLLVLVVYTFVLETDAYRAWIVNPFIGWVNDLCIFFARGESSKLFSALDKQALFFMDHVGKLWPSGWNPLDYFIAAVAILVMYFMFFVMFFAFLVIYTISYFSLCIFFLVGGIFILFGCIKATRGLFFAWLRHVFQFALTIIFASITLGLSFNGIKQSIAKIPHLDVSNIFTFDYLSLLAWCAITIALFLKSPDFAAGLTSTMAGSTAGIAGAMSTAAGAGAAGVAGGTASGAAGAVGAGAWLYNNRKDLGGGIRDLGSSATQALKDKIGIK